VAEWAAVHGVLFTLVFVRMSGLVLFVPFFDNARHPVQVKAGFCAVLALLVTGTLGPGAWAGRPLEWGAGAYFWAAAGEFGVGAVMGITAAALLYGVQMAGHLMGQNIGLDIANLLDPERDIEVSLVGQFKMLLFLAVFTAIDGHHVFLEAMARSYQAVPLAGLNVGWPAVGRMVGAAGFLFVLGLELSAPVVAAGLLVNVVLGFLGRTVPQLNIFIVGFPVRIALGLGVLLLMVSMMTGLAEALAAKGRAEMVDLLAVMGPPA
jgi:flagellar biosynthetic protein FliR